MRAHFNSHKGGLIGLRLPISEVFLIVGKVRYLPDALERLEQIAIANGIRHVLNHPAQKAKVQP